MSKRARSRWFNAIKVAVSVGMLAYVLLVRVNLGELGSVLSGARWGFLALGVLLSLAGVALRAVRWWALLRGLRIQVLLRRLVGLYFVGSFFNAFLPTALGGDAVRTVELARQSRKTPEAIGTVLVDRANGLWVLFAMGLLSLPFAARDIPPQMAILVGLVSIAAVAGGWVVMWTRFVPWLGAKITLPGQAKLERFYHAVSGCGYLALAQASGVSLLFNWMNVTVNYLIALGLNVERPFGIFLVYTPVLSVSLLVPSIGGLGVRETANVLLYGTVGVEDAFAAAMGLVQFAVQTLAPGLIGGLLYVVEGALGLRRGAQEDVLE